MASKTRTVPDTVACASHGDAGTVTFSYAGEVFRTVCFKCYAEKVTEGLADFTPRPRKAAVKGMAKAIRKAAKK